MRRVVAGKLGLAAWALGVALGAAPAAPSYVGVERAIERVRQGGKESASGRPQAESWNTFGDAARRELRAYATAGDEGARLRALGRLHRMAADLEGVTWAPAGELRAALRAWLEPRVRLAWAQRRVREAIDGLAPPASGPAQENRGRWRRFLDEDLGGALRAYEAAETVAARQEALKRVYGALTKLEGRNRAVSWAPTATLQEALNDLYNRPNFGATADVATVSPAFNANIVESGPITFKGNTSYVTAGPKTGFALLPSDNGIAFSNSQAVSSVTPINGFHQQIASDPQGRRAARLYYFRGLTRVSGEQQIIAVLRATGLVLFPGSYQNIAATINTVPIQGQHLARTIAGLLGYDQERITQQVFQQGINRIRQGVVENSRELTAIKTSEAAGQRNAQFAQYLVGNDTLAYRNLAITGLRLRSRPEYIGVGGTVQWQGAGDQVGADWPKPAEFETVAPGVAADVHLPSVMTNLARGAVQTEPVRDVRNLMIVTRNIPEGAPPSEGIVTTRNVDYEAYLKAVAEVQEADDPKVVAIRVKRPDRVPEFAADAHGNLVALVHDFTIEVPAPKQLPGLGRLLRGPAYRVYRIAAPQAEFVISLKVEPARGELPIRLAGRLESVDFGANATVTGLGEDEEKGTPLGRLLAAGVLGTLQNRLQGQPINVPLSAVRLPGFALNSVTPLDPSGWVRITLTKTGDAAGATASPSP
jgi:hypothetical protein